MCCDRRKVTDAPRNPPFEAVAAAVRERFELEHGDPTRDLVAGLRECTIEATANALRQVIVGRAAQVTVLWLRDRRLVRTQTHDVAERLARLWHAGRDNLLVVDPARRWAVLLDHETRLWAFDT